MSNRKYSTKARLGLKLGGFLSGSRNVVTGHVSRAGFFSGMVAVVEGRMDRMRTTESCSNGGKVAVATGQLALARQAGANPESYAKGARSRAALPPEIRGRAGRAGSAVTNHIRWHVKRGVVKTGCDLCQQN